MLDDFFSFLLKDASQTVLPKEERVSIFMLENKISLLRDKVMSQYNKSLAERTADREINVVGGQKDAITIKAEGQQDWSFRIIHKFGATADAYIDERLVRPGRFAASKDSEAKKLTGFLNSALLLVLDRQTLSFLKRVNRVVTDDNIDFAMFFSTLKQKVQEDPY